MARVNKCDPHTFLTDVSPHYFDLYTFLDLQYRLEDYIFIRVYRVFSFFCRRSLNQHVCPRRGLLSRILFSSQAPLLVLYFHKFYVELPMYLQVHNETTKPRKIALHILFFKQKSQTLVLHLFCVGFYTNLVLSLFEVSVWEVKNTNVGY